MLVRREDGEIHGPDLQARRLFIHRHPGREMRVVEEDRHIFLVQQVEDAQQIVVIHVLLGMGYRRHRRQLRPRARAQGLCRRLVT